jgi:hypothetical protein
VAGQFAANAVKPVFVESSGKRSNWTQLRPSQGASTIAAATAHAAIARQRGCPTRQASGSASTASSRIPSDRVSAHRPMTPPSAAAAQAVGRSNSRNASSNAATTRGAYSDSEIIAPSASSSGG